MNTSSEVDEWCSTVYERGLALIGLLGDAQHWVHRRVEAVRMSADLGNRVTISIDCTPPEESLIDGVLLVPLGIMAKGELSKLDVLGPDGNPLPVCTSEQNAELVTDMILTVLQESLPMNVVMSERCRSAVLQLVTCRPEDASVALAGFRGWLSAYDHVRQPLGEDLEFLLWHLADQFASQYMLLAVMPPERMGVRSIAKYSFDDTSSLPKHSHAPIFFTRTLSSPGLASSYHLEVEVPQGIGLRSLVLLEEIEADEGKVVYKERAYRPREQAVSLIHASLKPSSVLTSLEARAVLVPQREGLLRVAGFAALGTLPLILAAVALRAFSDKLLVAGEPTSNVAAVLLALPALMVVWLGGTSEHALVAALRARLRTVMMAVALILFSAALLVALPLQAHIEDWLWVGLLVGQVGTVVFYLHLRHNVTRKHYDEDLRG